MTGAAGRWLTVGEASRALGMSRTTLLAAEDAGLLVPVRTPGGHRRYDPGDLDRYLGRARPANTPGLAAAPHPAGAEAPTAHLVPAVRAALRPLAQALDADSAGLYLVRDAVLRFCAAFGVPRWLAGRLVDSAAPPVVEQAFAGRGHHIFDPAAAAFPDSRVAGHGLAVPLCRDDRAIGVLFLVTRAGRGPLPGELRIVDAFAVLLAAVVADQLRIAALEHRLARIAALSREG